MNLDLLRDWLSLKAGDWPPDHYALLGLAPGEGTAEEIEDRALERMELLRTHQIRHQEEVTEGMNRLAQAMVCLSDPASRRAYDQRVGLIRPDAGPRADGPEDRTESTLIEPETEEEEPLVLELLEDPPDVLPFDDEPLVLEFAEAGDDGDDGALLGERIVLTAEDLATPPKVVDYSPDLESREKRRERYAELARLRRLARAWERLGPYLADPEAPVSRPVDSQAFTTGLAELPGLLEESDAEVGQTGQPGHRVALLARHQLALQTFRGLVPSQRTALSEDWELARLHLRKRLKLIRAEIRRSLRPDWGRRVAAPLVRRLTGSPEWALVPVGLVALAVALWRS